MGSDKRLYRVRVEYEYFTLAESEEAAEEWAGEAVRSEEPSVFAAPLKRPQDLPKDWHGSIPYGEENDRTCGEILGVTWEEIAAANSAEWDTRRAAATPEGRRDA